MLFNSIEFFIFFVVIYGLYRLLPLQGQNSLLLIGSYFFYGWWDVQFLYLIVLSTAIDFCCGAMIDKGKISLRNRQLVSALVLLAAFCFDTIQWDALQRRLRPVDLTALLPNSFTGWSVFWASIALVGIANFLYPYATRLVVNRRRGLFLVLSISINLLLLGVFKYLNFFVENLDKLSSLVGVSFDVSSLHLILPVGISFYTFKAISYAVDVYQGKLKSSDNFWDFSLFWAYFPPLFAGPIDRAAHLLPQLESPRQLSFQQSAEGIFLILFGLFKKVAIADGIAGSVAAIYDGTGWVSWLDIIAATILYAIQIYCDFSGYSDTARGVSKLLGIELIFNFNLPYFSQNPSEFWRRWHISLSTWLRDYLYIPLGGNRRGEGKTYRNLMITMLLGGLWHGAAWNFVLWGFYQGLLLWGHRALNPPGKPNSPEQGLWSWFWSWLRIFGFFLVTCYGWLLFRATSLTQIVKFTGLLVTDFGNLALAMPRPPLSVLLGIPVLLTYELIEYLRQKPAFSQVALPIRAAFYAILIFILLMGGSNEPAQFIYSQF
jgi:D-alanyl-lipoteichoic acid acyltransferase DltB (MBOAT superfamily)